MSRGIAVAALILGAAAAFFAWRISERRAEAGRRFIALRKAIDARRFDEAARLAPLILAERPGDPETLFLLGIADAALDRDAEAVEAWRAVAPGSAFADRAKLETAQLRFARGGAYAEAERDLLDVLKHAKRGPAASQAREVLKKLYRFQSREAEVARLVEAEFDLAPSPALLREHWKVETDTFPLDGIRTELARADKLAPDDGRVQLGLANMALREGEFDTARRRLETCLKQSPDDPAVWRSKLELALAVGNRGDVVEAARKLPAGELGEAERLRLAAWLAGGARNQEAERKALKALMSENPERALERLADLDAAAGNVDEARKSRVLKAELDKARERYRFLLENASSPPDPLELGGLAEKLGRKFEARGWFTLRLRQNPGDAVALSALERIGEAPAKTASSGKSVADLFEPKLLGEKPPGAVSPSLSIPKFGALTGPSAPAFRYEHGPTAVHHLPETMSGGVGLIDYDGDGRLDIYAVQGGTFPPPAGLKNGDRLFRNLPDGSFADVTEKTGLAAFPGGYGHGVAVGDIDNDGHSDLFVTRWRGYALYRNKGNGTFENVTESWGLGGDRDWPTSAAFADLDGDGDLDLYVCHYLAWDAEHPDVCYRHKDSKEVLYCDPRKFSSLPDHLFRNDNGKFVDVTAEAGIVDPDGRGLGVVATDLDGDGRLDLYVANDTTANFAFRNKGGMKFEEVGHLWGLAGNADGGYQASMGIAAGDLDGDGRADLAVTNFYGEGTTFYHNLGGGMFSDRSDAQGFTALTKLTLGFGLAFGDMNNDGRLDVVQVNGHVNDYAPYVPYAMPTRLMLGTGEGGRLRDAGREAGEVFGVPRLGRGLAVGDLDNDGSLDFVLMDAGKPLVVAMQTPSGMGRWIRFALEGGKSGRDAVGAEIRIKAGGRSRVASRFGGGSYLSAGDPRLHFGLGAVNIVDEVTVRWPSGSTRAYKSIPANREYRLKEGEEPVPVGSGGPR